jgi:prepilin-type N-terminal cleavage/methylation domain-containing protein
MNENVSVARVSGSWGTPSQPRKRWTGWRERDWSPRKRPLSIEGVRRSAIRGFTLIELVIVVAIIAILAAIMMVNFKEAIDRSLKASDAANLHVIATALQKYMVDFNTLPPADMVAGSFQSHGTNYTLVGDAPAAGGSWDGLPWLLYDLHYITEWQTMFCPRYVRDYNSGLTLNTKYGKFPRFHNFRYAYNSSSLATGGHAGGTGIMTGVKWMVRDLYLPATSGWYGSSAPAYPADYKFPWGEGNDKNTTELVLYADFGVHERFGGTDKAPK